MSETIQDCTTCLHSMVCRYVKDFQRLMQLGSLTFNCRYHLTAEPIKDIEEDNPYKDMSKEEFLKMMESEKPENIGICESCGTKETLYTCDKCGRHFCPNCIEAEENFSLDGDSTETYLCKKCRGEES